MLLHWVSECFGIIERCRKIKLKITSWPEVPSSFFSLVFIDLNGLYNLMPWSETILPLHTNICSDMYPTLHSVWEKKEISIGSNVLQKEIGKYIKTLGEALQLSQPINNNVIFVHMPRLYTLLQLNKSAKVFTRENNILIRKSLFNLH